MAARSVKPARSLSVGPGRVDFVTEIADTEIVLQEAMAVIDQALGTMQTRELVSSDEVSDLLLDLRLLLAGIETKVPAVTGV